MVLSRSHDGVYWVHNDSGEPAIYAVDRKGDLLGTFTLGVKKARDWEDIAVGPCGRGQGDCLYVGDIGNNYAEQDTIRLYRVREPADPTASGELDTETFPMVFDGPPPDMEAMFIMPGGDLYFVSKGRQGPVTLYRYPMPLRGDSTVTLEPLQRIGDEPRSLPRQVTGADASPDGRWVAVRTYETLIFERFDGRALTPLDDGTVNLRTLREAQGEGVGVAADGTVVLVSEAGPMGKRGGMAVLRCRVP